MKIFFIYCFLLFFIPPCHLSAEGVWGKDASLVSETSKPQRTDASKPLLNVILFHQQVLSKADGPRSHFYPISSEYGKRALSQWGMCKGFCLLCDRLMRENSAPWIYPMIELPDGTRIKYDPVPKI